MKTIILLLCIALFSNILYSQEEVKRKDGKIIIINNDGTWKYKKELNDISISENKFIGKWHIKDNEPSFGGDYLKIEKNKNGRLVFCEGFKSEGYPITWCEDNTQNQFYVKLSNGKLIGEISSYNFRATHSLTFNYRITLTLLSENKMQYSVWSSISGETDIREAIKMNE